VVVLQNIITFMLHIIFTCKIDHLSRYTILFTYFF